MARLQVSLPDELELEFTCANYAKVRGRALAFVLDVEKLKATCRCDRTATLTFFPEDETAAGAPACAWDEAFDGFFFDNTDYNVYARLEGHAFKNLRVKSRFSADEGNGKFSAFEHGQVRSGTLNFENDIGNFDFSLEYEDDTGGTRTLTFTGEVLSQKVDARKDWKTMIDDVEARYSMLAADYLKRTYHSFDRTKNSESEDTPDLVWWNLFESERQQFFKAVKTVIERPRKRLRREIEYRRADQLRCLTPVQENQFCEFRRDASHLYRLEYDASSHDTPENRFVKFAVGDIGRTYEKLRKLICSESEFGKRISEGEKERMSSVSGQFKKTLAHPFFKGVGKFTGFKQLSLTLQNAPGYASVARIYAILSSSYMLFEGMRRLETKNVADLYEIWCFLKVEEIVKRSCQLRFGEYFLEPEASHAELSGKFVKQLDTGSKSHVIFKVRDPEGREDVELARVVYNPKVTEADHAGDNGLPGVIIPTGLTSKKGQIPDIVLRLSRDSMNKGEKFQLTYLFDAKYRIEDAEGEGADVTMRPPQDAIDQMHRYRDALYYAEADKQKSLNPADLKREVVGGYVLFPGRTKDGAEIDKPTDADDYPPFFRSIHQVNIGAIPLRPNDNQEYGHLIKFIERLLVESPTLEAALDRINPQHGEILDNATQEGVAEAVLCGTYRDKQKKWIVDNNLYNLPKETAEKTGIFSKEDADRKRVLVLLSSRGYLELSKPYKIVGCQEVDKNTLWQDHGYPRRPGDEDEGDKQYYLFTIKPLFESMADVSQRLRIVTLNKPGVCQGVIAAAAADPEHEIECTIADDMVDAARQAHGIVVFDNTGVVLPATRPVIQKAQALRKSHQPLAMNVKLKKTRKVLVRWMRILLTQVNPPHKYVLYIDGREDADLETGAKQLLCDVLKML